MRTHPVLSTDLYELTMLAAYHRTGLNPVSVSTPSGRRKAWSARSPKASSR